MFRILTFSALLSISSFAYSYGKTTKPNNAPVSKTPAAAKVTPTTLTFTTVEIQGKKVWLPVSTQIVPGKYLLQLKNTLSAPHGFEIKGLTAKAIVVPANGSKSVEVDAKKGDYKITCHMHPAHVGATLVVK